MEIEMSSGEFGGVTSSPPLLKIQTIYGDFAGDMKTINRINDESVFQMVYTCLSMELPMNFEDCSALGCSVEDASRVP